MNKFYSYNYYCRITANSVLTDLVTNELYFKTYSEAYDYYAQEYTKYIQPIELLVDIKWKD